MADHDRAQALEFHVAEVSRHHPLRFLQRIELPGIVQWCFLARDALRFSWTEAQEARAAAMATGGWHAWQMLIVAAEPASEDGLTELYDLTVTSIEPVSNPVAPFAKVDQEKRQVSAYLLVSDRPDLTGDVVLADELMKTAHRFLHEGALQSTIVASFIDTQGFHGIVGGWWVTIQIESDLVWAAIATGKIKGLGYIGRGKRRPLARPAQPITDAELAHFIDDEAGELPPRVVAALVELKGRRAEAGAG